MGLEFLSKGCSKDATFHGITVNFAVFFVKKIIDREEPEIVIIDSIQTMYNEEVASAPGSVSQVRETTGTLMQIAKGKNISIFIVGHVTKE